MLKTYHCQPRRIDWEAEGISAKRRQVYRHEHAWNELERGRDEFAHLCDLFGHEYTLAHLMMAD